MKGKPIELGQQSVDTWWRFLVAKYGFDQSQVRPYTFSLAPSSPTRTWCSKAM